MVALVVPVGRVGDLVDPLARRRVLDLPEEALELGLLRVLVDAADRRAVLDGLDAGVRAQGVRFFVRGVDDEALEAREAEVVEDGFVTCVEIKILRRVRRRVDGVAMDAAGDCQ